MKPIISLIILSFTAQFSMAQACGIYRIKYVGKISTESVKVEKVKLPTTYYLHLLKDKNSGNAFIEDIPEDNEIVLEISSHLTSNLYDKGQSLFDFYKKKREKTPIVFVVSKNNVQKEITTELFWEQITISAIDDKGFGQLFEINLNEIELK